MVAISLEWTVSTWIVASASKALSPSFYWCQIIMCDFSYHLKQNHLASLPWWATKGSVMVNEACSWSSFLISWEPSYILALQEVLRLLWRCQFFSTLFLSSFQSTFFSMTMSLQDISMNVFLKYNTLVFFPKQLSLSIIQSFLQASGSPLWTKAIRLRRNTSITITHLNAMNPSGSLSSVGLLRPPPGTEFYSFLSHLSASH